ncbi:flagellar biosynthetic protein FliR [Streptomyces adustus]|uniref:Flagellar biosynthetic protein FliR n=1 Tax=Streptomyces adustus TaxID=1609272 RepID=A0A5N8VE16_9ACTN|nr:hypothetical protein [Streptomyces adustus]MPY33483.1 flagellar biosynthetic protein FliR [Streptomyces adustus]
MTLRRKFMLSAAASVLAIVGMLTGAGSASANGPTNGQQVSVCAARTYYYRSAVLIGHNQNDEYLIQPFKLYQANGNPEEWCMNAYDVESWWWKGDMQVNWYDDAGNYKASDYFYVSPSSDSWYPYIFHRY